MVAAVAIGDALWSLFSPQRLFGEFSKGGFDK
jgi:hypothetical protein